MLFQMVSQARFQIDFHRDNDEYSLTVQDNGVGLPEDLNLENSESLGMQLIYSLVTQLDGRIEVSSVNGARFDITFK